MLNISAHGVVGIINHLNSWKYLVKRSLRAGKSLQEKTCPGGMLLIRFSLLPLQESSEAASPRPLGFSPVNKFSQSGHLSTVFF